MLNLFFLVIFQAGSAGTSTAEVPAAHFEPQVAVMCEPRATYHNQYMTEAGHWVSDPETKAICPRDKMAVLEYCKKVSTQLLVFKLINSFLMGFE
jgi:Amyloid A4 N-terminal heparin-binding